jgi:hypothetical protein
MVWYIEQQNAAYRQETSLSFERKTPGAETWGYERVLTGRDRWE